jgi:hypothetical protein
MKKSNWLHLDLNYCYNRLTMASHHVSIYRGLRDKTGRHVLVDDRPLRHVVLHSLTGLEWGYGGSGPADLALSILARYFKVRYVNTAYFKKFPRRSSKAEKYYQSFKWDFVAKWEKKEWMITSDDIAVWLQKQNQQNATATAA